MEKNTIIIAVVVLAVLAAFAYFLLNKEEDVPEETILDSASDIAKAARKIIIKKN